MKIIARTLIILAAALLVVGATLAFSRSSYATSALVGGGGFDRGGFEQRGQRPPQGGFAPGAPQGGFDRGGFEGQRGRGFSLFGIAEVLRNLVIIALIVVVVAPIVRLLQRRRV